MRTILLAATAAAALGAAAQAGPGPGAAPAAPASVAGGVRAQATVAIIDICAADSSLPMATARTACACGAGVISARASDREMAILARMVPVVNNSAAAAAEAGRLVAEGYAATEIQSAGQVMIDAESLVDATCGVLER